VLDVDNESIPIEKRNGFSFQSPDEEVRKMVRMFNGTMLCV
jgi:hypothetical protein